MESVGQNFIDRKNLLEATLHEGLSVDGLTGPLRILQRLQGHRYSTDDTCTAWYALQKCPEAARVLDLGSGVGSVGLIVLWGLGEMATLTCVEAQDISFQLLSANIECNLLAERVQTIHGDLRDLDLSQKFPLITGSPPYFPANAGILPSDSQKAHARFELRGHLGDYARAAKKHLEDDGVFVYCFPFQQKSRGLKLVREAGFKIASIRDVKPTPSKAPLFSLYSARLNWDLPTEEEAPLLVSDQHGQYTPEMQALQLTRGF